MWLDAEVEDAYAKAFGFEGKDKVVVLNPGKRKRFVAHDEDISFSALSNLFLIFFKKINLITFYIIINRKNLRKHHFWKF